MRVDVAAVDEDRPYPLFLGVVSYEVMRGGAKKGWRWRVADPDANKDLNLLYEPGNWGDVIKGAWSIATARALSRGRPSRRFRYLDPFAGAPTYPLVEASLRRLRSVPVEAYVKLQGPYVEQGKMASTGLLVRDATRLEGIEPELDVFDTDPARVEAWRGESGVRILDVPSGEAALERLRARRAVPDMVLVDPYDFFVRWQVLLPAALAAAARSVVLVYCYNRAPRGPGQQRMYGDFRDALRKGTGSGVGALLGRVPADSSLARAYHEVVLLGPDAFLRQVKDELAADARALARAIVEDGAFEAVLPEGGS